MTESNSPREPRPVDEPPSERERRLGNIALLAIFVVVVALGVWLVNAMLEQRAIDDCAAQGRRNCTPIEAPRSDR